MESREKKYGRYTSSHDCLVIRPRKVSTFLGSNHTAIWRRTAVTVKTSSIAGKQMSFAATLENWAEGMDYCAVAVPAKITEALGTHSAVLVLACVNDSAPFQVSLFPVGGGRHYIRIKAKVRKETGTKTGDRVNLRFTVLDRAAVTYPADLLAALRVAGATREFKALPPGRRNFIVRRIDEAVKPETRQKRIADAVKEVQRVTAERTDRATSSHKRSAP